ncbi:MAG TPA: xylan 1,4-beta-xylosidase, partial [Paludibacter sp.]
FDVFNATSDETRAKYNEAQQKGQENKRFLSLSVWTPNVNIFRDPRWGRGQETYGEDPYLTSRMGISVVKGLQGPEDSKYKKLLACAKHFAVHSGPEWNRHVLNVNDVNPRDLWETYLPAFKSLVQDANVREVMCAYQRLDDEPCCGNTRLLQNILREDWGFRYMVVSDCGAIADFWQNHKVSSDATHAAAKGVLAGTDVECGFGYAFMELPKAVEKGLISESEIDTHLMRLLVGRFDLGEMDDAALVPWSKIPLSIVNSADHKKLALNISRESMTLLQNRNNILPIPKNAGKIAILGPNAADEPLLWGNYNGTPNKTITILNGIKSKISGAKLIYDRACDLTEDRITQSVIGQCSIDGKKGLKVTYWNNRNWEGNIVTTQQIVNSLKLSVLGQHEFAEGVHLNNFSGKIETVYKPTKSGEIAFKLEACGELELFINGDSVSNIRMYRPLAKRVLFKVEAGKEYKIEARFKQVDDWTAALSFDFGNEIPVKFDELINKLKGVDYVIFAGGISAKLEGEEMPLDISGFKGGDRTDIELPAIQRECLKALKNAGKKVIFVNCSGSAMGLVPETASCDAILQAWYGGEQGGQAVADVLFGDYNPSGKLPITFYKNVNQLSGFEDYSMKGRTYRFMSDPLFPFGFGLSYTNFSIGDATLTKNVIAKTETVNITIPVTNTGKCNGTEVVQVYIRKVNDIEGPLKTLKGFQRVEIESGKSKQVIIPLAPSSFEFYNWSQRKMQVDSGEYEVLYGNSSDTKDLKMIKLTIQ